MDMNVQFKIAAGVTGQQAVDSLKTSMEKLGDTANVVGKGTLSLANNFTALANPVGSLTGLFERFAGMAGLAGAAAGLIKITNSAIESAASLATLSIKTGIQVETLSRFSTVAKLADTDMGTVAETLKRLSNSTVDAATGNDKLAKLFRAVGIEVRDSEGKIKAADAVLVELARNVQGIDPEIVTKLMTELGGKSGANIIPFLREVNERLDDTKAKVSEAFGQNAKEYSDNLVLLQGNVAALGRSIAEELLPRLIRVTEEMIKAKEGGLLEQMWRGINGVVIEASTNFNDIEGEIVKVEGRLKTLRETLASFEGANAFVRWWSADDIAILKTQIDQNEQALRMLENQRQRLANPTPLNPPTDPVKTLAVTTVLAENNKPTGGGTDPYTSELQNLGREAAKLRFQSAHVAEFQDRITTAKVAMIQFDIEQGKFKDLSAAQKQALLEAARAVDQYGVSLKQSLAGLDYEKQTKKIEAETSAIGQGILAKQQALALQDLENKGIKQGSELYEELAQARMRAIQGAYEASRSFGTGVQSFVTSYVEESTNSAKQIGQALTGAFNAASDALVDFVTTGKFNFSNFATSILKDLARIAIQRSILGPLASLIGGFMPSFGGGTTAGGAGAVAFPVANANGNAFNNGSITAFANGGVVGSPTLFPMANGMGLMGEAGPEAIMPLSRDASGRLGVKSQGGSGGDQFNISVSVASDGGMSSKGNSQAGEGLGRAIAGAVRQEIMNQKRPGGLLAPGAIA